MPHVGPSAHVKHIYHAYAAYARPQPTAPFVSAFAVEAANCKFPQLDAIANATPHVNSVGNSQGLDRRIPHPHLPAPPLSLVASAQLHLNAKFQMQLFIVQAGSAPHSVNLGHYAECSDSI